MVERASQGLASSGHVSSGPVAPGNVSTHAPALQGSPVHGSPVHGSPVHGSSVHGTGGASQGADAVHGAPGEVEAATRRLAAALEALEAAVERRRDADRNEDELAARIHALGTDRSRLANELDGALVRSRELERINRDVAERLDRAIDTIRSVIGTGD